MSRITLRSNLASLNAQRRLTENTARLSESFTRLSSGLRINRARDDASGLAISEDLRVDARVFAQGVRNLNDSISLLNIAEGATTELTGILIRQRELATQAANGSLSYSQREALHEESKALSAEYNRIVDTTEFNDLSLVDGSLDDVRAQAGYGADGAVVYSLGEELARAVGTGEYAVDGTYKGVSSSALISILDFNGDGIDDVATSGGAGSIRVHLNDGEGNLATEIENLGYIPSRVIFGDFDNDGVVDTLGSTASQLRFHKGNADGTIESYTEASATPFTVSGNVTNDAVAQDVNNDGKLDLVLKAGFSIAVLTGRGDGSFNPAQTLSSGASTGTVNTGDFNGDGKVDIVTAGGGGVALRIALGNGDGSFQAQTEFSTGVTASRYATGDFNDDGLTDIASGTIVFLANGDGSFKAGLSTDVGTGSSYTYAEDMNSDGYLDLVARVSTEVAVAFGNGDGSFAAAVSSTTLSDPLVTYNTAFGDINNDGAQDFLFLSAVGTSGHFNIMLAETEESNTTKLFQLRTREGALQSIREIDAALERVGQELGAIGAVQSRLNTAFNALQQQRESYIAAASQIADVDVARETANLVRSRILQEANAAVLAQSNRQADIALQLLNTS